MYNQITEKIYCRIMKSIRIENVQNEHSDLLKLLLYYEYTSFLNEKIKILKKFIKEIIKKNTNIRYK